MPNLRRGEITADLGGRTLTLCLTLGALAEIEGAFGIDGLAALAARFEGGKLSARDLIVILGAAARGAGEKISDAEIAALPLADGLDGHVHAVVALMRATFGATEEEAGGEARPFELAACNLTP